MEMTNEELNKKIHAARRECFHDWKTFEDTFPNGVRSGFHWECGKCNKTLYQKKRPAGKDYPGNIAHARELIDSISQELLSKRLEFNEKLQEEVSRQMGLDGLISFRDLIFHITPTAICLAYVEVMG